MCVYRVQLNRHDEYLCAGHPPLRGHIRSRIGFICAFVPVELTDGTASATAALLTQMAGHYGTFAAFFLSYVIAKLSAIYEDRWTRRQKTNWSFYRMFSIACMYRCMYVNVCVCVCAHVCSCNIIPRMLYPIWQKCVLKWMKTEKSEV